MTINASLCVFIVNLCFYLSCILVLTRIIVCICVVHSLDRWAFAVQEAGSPIVFALTVWYYMSNSGDSAAAVWSKLWSNGPAPLLCMLMFQIHYIHRAFIFPLKTVSMNDSKLFVMLMALVFTCVNGYLNAKYLLLFQNQVPTLSVLLGIVLFALGMWQNIACDNHLIALRARRAQPSGEKDRVTSGEKETMTSGEKDLVTTGVTKVHRQYFIPTVGLFHWVSAGNYLGEMIEWIGFAVSSQNCASITFALFTFTNLFPRALSTHRYYLEKFRGEYPKNRKAIIPFLL